MASILGSIDYYKDEAIQDQSQIARLNLKCSFLRFYKSSGHFVYSIQLDCMANDTTWNITKRYNDFHQLRLKLRSLRRDCEQNGLQSPSFPKPVVKFTDSAKHKLAAERMHYLEIYLKELISRSIFLSSPDVRAFLQMPPSVRDLAHIYHHRGVVEHSLDLSTRTIPSVAVSDLDEIDEIRGDIESIRNEMKAIKSKMNQLWNVVMAPKDVDENEEKKEDHNMLKIDNDHDLEPELETNELAAVRRWMVNEVKLPQYMDLFVDNGFEDLSVIQALTMNDLIEMGIEKKGHRIKITQCISRMNARSRHSVIAKSETIQSFEGAECTEVI